jgi:hypothetical protein
MVKSDSDIKQSLFNQQKEENFSEASHRFGDSCPDDG